MAEFNESLDKLKSQGIGVVALSIDAEKYAQKSVDKHDVKFPVIYGLDAREIAPLFGGFIEEEKGFFHATNFILKDGKVRHATYSTGPLGRLQADHVSMLVGYYQGQEAKAKA